MARISSDRRGQTGVAYGTRDITAEPYGCRVLGVWSGADLSRRGLRPLARTAAVVAPSGLRCPNRDINRGDPGHSSLGTTICFPLFGTPGGELQVLSANAEGLRGDLTHAKRLN